MPRRRLTSDSRGQAHFDLWVTDGAHLLAEFAERMSAAGGPASQLTLTPESLSVAFGWTAGQVQLSPAEVIDDGNLPSWQSAGRPTSPFGDFDAESARWADGLSRYYGEVLVRHLPGVQWVMADEPRRRAIYPDQWWPVISGPLLAVNPLEAGGLAARQGLLPAAQRDVDWLLRNYRSYFSIVTGHAGEPAEPAGWQVDDIDLPSSRAAGWRYSISGPEEDLDEATVAEMGRALALLPGVAAVDREDRASWLVAGQVDRSALEVLARSRSLRR